MKTEDSITSGDINTSNCEKFHRRKKFGFGLVAILVGVVLLINVIHPHLIDTKFIWPVVIILIGLKWIIFSKHSHKHCHHRSNC